MVTGPQQTRLDIALTGAAEEVVSSGSREWSRCADLLSTVAQALTRAAGAETVLGGQTGPAMATAFRTTSDGMEGKTKQLRRGSEALGTASNAIMAARVGVSEMNRYTPQKPDPGSFNPPPGPLSDADIKAQSTHQADVTAFHDSFATRERIAQQWADHMDQAFAESTATMKDIHGEKDPDLDEPTDRGRQGPQPIGTGPGGSTRPSSGTGHVVHTGHTGDDDPPPRDPTGEPTPPTGDPLPPTGDPVPPTGDPVPPTPPFGTPPGGFVAGEGATTAGSSGGSFPGGASTSALGAVAGGGLASAAMGGIRGGMVSPSGSVAGAPVRPIGSTTRAGASGALGRGGTTGTGSPTSRPGGRGGGAGGRGAGGSGGSAGKPGRRGAAGAGGAAGRRGGKKDEDERGSDRDLFDDGQDWIDDAEAAPGVID